MVERKCRTCNYARDMPSGKSVWCYKHETFCRPNYVCRHYKVQAWVYVLIDMLFLLTILIFYTCIM